MAKAKGSTRICVRANRQVHYVTLRDIVELDWADYAPDTITVGLRRHQEWGRFGWTEPKEIAAHFPKNWRPA